MALRILAVLAEPGTARACLEAAAAAASVDPATTIEALCITEDPRGTGESAEEAAIQRLRDHFEGTPQARTEAVHAVYDDWLAGIAEEHHAQVTWRERAGDEGAVLVAEAPSADLLILARPHDISAHDAVHAAIFHAERPLLVPPDWVRTGGAPLARKIAIAWKSTPQAHRALVGAGPWLRAADEVRVFAVAPSVEVARCEECHHVLRDLGVKADTTLLPPGDGDVGDEILKAIGEWGADALVMGAFRHGAIMEAMLGGTTRTIFAKASLPIFTAH
ncbi:universal stress protein [Segnochrobactrum spirostomi]|nr:universal stress protein [Segnochrobactrum spirostomi]